MYLHSAAESGISTFKYQEIAGLWSIDPDLPMKNWYHLLEQLYITLNLLYPSILNPNLSVYAQLNGTSDYNMTPVPLPQAPEP